MLALPRNRHVRHALEKPALVRQPDPHHERADDHQLTLQPHPHDQAKLPTELAAAQVALLGLEATLDHVHAVVQQRGDHHEERQDDKVRECILILVCRPCALRCEPLVVSVLRAPLGRFEKFHRRCVGVGHHASRLLLRATTRRAAKHRHANSSEKTDGGSRRSADHCYVAPFKNLFVVVMYK